MAPAAARAFRKLPDDVRRRLRTALQGLAETEAGESRVGGKKVKTIQDVPDSFRRLRVGDCRLIHDLIPEDRVLLVLGIVAAIWNAGCATGENVPPLASPPSASSRIALPG